jgi:hypothetical protein
MCFEEWGNTDACQTSLKSIQCIETTDQQENDMNIQTTDQQENDMKATNKFPLEISVIHGTLRNQDLIPAFLEAVLQLDPDTPMALINTMMPEELREVPQDNDDHEWWYTETAYWVLEHLDNKLNDYAPDGYYFGAHEGDGSDFGFWRIIDEEE